MPNYRRAKVAGGTYLFTLVTHRRRSLFGDPQAKILLGNCFRECRERWFFETRAIVLLPDHLHVIWSLPRGDAEYSRRWSWIKKEFTKQWLAICDLETDISPARKKEGRRGVWQPRFWEHTIETEIDYERHFDYIHYNPVKHGYVKCLHEWAPSSFHRWGKAGVLPWHWACWQDGTNQLSFEDIHQSVGE